MIEPKIEQIHIEEPPCKIEEFIDRLHQRRQRIVPGSLIWLSHPEKPGQVIAAVMVENITLEETGDLAGPGGA